MNKTALDTLFSTRLRSIGSPQLLDLQQKVIQNGHAEPFLWTDPKSGLAWTLLGRKAHFLWTDPSDTIKNHKPVESIIKGALKGNPWHESIPGRPDILAMLLATGRYGPAHSATRYALQGIMQKAVPERRAPGNGVKGDGGWIDTLLGMLESDVAQPQSRERLNMIYIRVVVPWMLGSVMHLNTGWQADWRQLSSERTPRTWPDEVLARVLRLAVATRDPASTKTLIGGVAEAEALWRARQTQDAPLGDELLLVLAQDANTAHFTDNDMLPTGAWQVFDRHAALGSLPRGVAEGLWRDVAHMDSLPRLKAAICEQALQQDARQASSTGARFGRL